LKFINFVIR